MYNEKTWNSSTCCFFPSKKRKNGITSAKSSRPMTWGPKRWKVGWFDGWKFMDGWMVGSDESFKPRSFLGTESFIRTNHPSIHENFRWSFCHSKRDCFIFWGLELAPWNPGTKKTSENHKGKWGSHNKYYIVGGWTTPSPKYARQIWGNSLQVRVKKKHIFETT